MTNVQVILWAQWRAVRAMLPRSGPWAFVLGGVWYLAWMAAAIAIGTAAASANEIGLIRAALPGALQLMVLYWQVVPVLLSATGASLDLQKLKAYPIALRDLFGIEVVLRATAAVEMLLLLLGAAAGSVFNPKLPWYSPLAFLPFVLFNLLLAVGLRDLLNMLLRHRRFREISVLLLVCLAALPSVLATHPDAGKRLRFIFTGTSSQLWPWAAAANLFQGREVALSLASLALWILAALCFSALQYRRTYRSDQELAPSAGFRTAGEGGVLERLFRWPSMVFRDPLAILIEKEIRFLARSPRFRLVFLMGFTFGLVIWLPMIAGRAGMGNSFLGSNYLTVVSVYALLLLSEVCFWNSFGFDRSATQIYFLAPVRFSRVLMAKNLTAAFFVSLEVGAITLVCGLAGMPVTPPRMLEAYSVAAVVGLFLLGAGNLLSVQNARAVNPDTSFRSGAPSRIQAMLMIIYPITFIPVGLAYLARYGFGNQLAFYGVLMFDAILGAVLYKVALDSAVGTSEQKREEMIAALSEGEGPIAA
jgi:ABC-2 type transport system permease protein